MGISEEQYLKNLRDFCFRFTEKAMESSVKRDELLVQAVVSIDDFNKEINLLVSRLREWYGLIDPESSKQVEDHEKFVKKVLENPSKTLFGLDMNEQDKRTLVLFAELVKQQYKLKDKIESYVDSLMDEIAPNVKSLAGPVLGARLIAKAGGLYKLAIMPGSTIQVLGAEKALFRHLVKGTPSPKHGMIFQHPVISNKPKKVRGKLAIPSYMYFVVSGIKPDNCHIACFFTRKSRNLH